MQNLGHSQLYTFFHYDVSFRILKDKYPVRDFWIVSGFIIDLMQSVFLNYLALIGMHMYFTLQYLIFFSL